MIKQWNELKASITELRDNGGTGTQQEVCKFLVNLMDALEKQMQEPCDDTVYRQAVLDALEWTWAGKKAIDAVKALPPAEPEPICVAKVTLTDEQVKEAVEKAKCEILTVLSAEPERKKGQWTDNNDCPFCGCQPWYAHDIHTLSFCPNCGADMRGEKHETD